jgi:hypothetical protein
MKTFAAAIFQNIRVCKVQKSTTAEGYPGRYGKRAAREHRKHHDIALLSNRSTFENINLRIRFGFKMVGTPIQGPFVSSLPTQPLNSDQRRLPFIFKLEVDVFAKKLL